jgi:hypothetical protein
MNIQLAAEHEQAFVQPSARLDKTGSMKLIAQQHFIQSVDPRQVSKPRPSAWKAICSARPEHDGRHENIGPLLPNTVAGARRKQMKRTLILQKYCRTGSSREALG